MANKQSFVHVPAWYFMTFNGIFMFSANYLLWDFLSSS